MVLTAYVGQERVDGAPLNAQFFASSSPICDELFWLHDFLCYAMADEPYGYKFFP